MILSAISRTYKMAESLIKAKVGSDGTLNNDEFHKGITKLKSKKEAEDERSILDMTQDGF